MNKCTMVKIWHLAFRLGQQSLWRQWLLCALVGPLALHTWAGEVDGRTKAFMHTFVVEFAKMSPYLANDAAFTSEKGKATVSESINTLVNKAGNPPPELKQSPGFRITYGLLTDHLQKTQQALSNGELQYARMRVNGIGNLCAACHMQAPKISHFSAFEFVVERGKQASLENAEFLFVIRRYDEALALYDKLAREFPKNGLSSDQLGEVYRRKLGIFARVYRDPVKAIANLNMDLKNSNLPPPIRQSVDSWILALSQWKSEKVDPSRLETPALLSFVNKSLPTDVTRKIGPGHPQLLDILRLSGLLYERLYKEPSSDSAQELLYTLARCERSLSPLYWYSVSEIYLKECIVQYRKKPFSKKCYDAYSEGMLERYSGKPIPEGVQQSIDALKDYL